MSTNTTAAIATMQQAQQLIEQVRAVGTPEAAARATALLTATTVMSMTAAD